MGSIPGLHYARGKNHKVSKARLGHAYSVHGITGSLGWALAPAMLVSITLISSWRVALVCAGALTFTVLLVLWLNREKLELAPVAKTTADASAGASGEGSLDFLRIPAVWMCFAFFFFYAMALSVVQAFAPEAARQLHEFPVGLVAMWRRKRQRGMQSSAAPAWARMSRSG